MSNFAGTVLLAAIEGDTPNAHELEFINSSGASGITLFRRNVGSSLPHMREFNQQLQQARPSDSPPLIIAIDQEGGRVSRLPAPFPNLGPAQQLFGGGVAPAVLDQLKQYGCEVGRGLLDIGINVDFAPVVDILTNPVNSAIGDRVFALSPEHVTLRAGAFLEGLQSTGAFGCLKHFPGQGDAGHDTHLSGAIIEVARSTLFERELYPYAKLLPHAALVMIAHCVYPAFDDKIEASRSAKVMQDLLRGQFGYRGLIITDDFNMEAIPQGSVAWQEAVCEAIVAGADLVLVCRHMEKCQLACEGIERMAAKSPAFAQRLTEAVKGVLAFRKRLPY